MMMTAGATATTTTTPVVVANAATHQHSNEPRTTTTTYRGGFSSSICNLFSNYRQRSDCCAIACCGLLLSDRTRFLLEGTHASWWKRLLVNLGLPALFVVCMYILTATLATTETEVLQMQQWTLYGLVLLVILLSVRGRWERIKLRTKVMRHMHQERFDENSEGHATLESYLRMHSGDVRRAHGSICCYPNDELYTYSTSQEEGEGEEHQGDFCTCLWKIFATMCCGACCNCWLQCCGMCAIGQEYREIDSGEKMDYITFESFQEYYPKIQELRNNSVMSFWAHARALSLLSKKLLQVLGLALAALLIISLTPINGDFTPLNLLVVLATFFQAFFILYLVHWQWCRLDLSLDAVVKYFASGFILCTGLAMAYELLISLVLGIVVNIIVVVGIVEEQEEESDDDALQPITPEDAQKYAKQFAQDNPWIFALFIFLNAFVVAALVEELAKYFSFWMVEHADFGDLDRVTSTSIATTRTTYLGVDTQDEEQGGETEENPNESNSDDSTPRRTLDSLGCGITVAMVATALGFACCENLLYVFVYTPPTISNEISTLIARSLFPVHPLAAAIQSIGVCQRDLEGRQNVGVGKIVFFAWLLHGSFDFVLMIISFISGLNTDETTDDKAQEEEEEKMEIPALIGSVGIMVLGIVYYICMARAQRRKLKALEITAGQDELTLSTATTPIV